MKITAEQYAQALYQALSEAKPADSDRVLDNFAKILQENGHLQFFPEIERAFVAYDQKARGQIPVTVTTAREGTTERQILEKLNELVGGDVEITKRLDASLLGGVLIETEDRRVDASVRAELKQLKRSLIE